LFAEGGAFLLLPIRRRRRSREEYQAMRLGLALAAADLLDIHLRTAGWIDRSTMVTAGTRSTAQAARELGINAGTLGN
jgi:hypothetical protein